MAVTTVTAACGFLTQLVFNDAYIWLVNIVGISGIIMWLGIAVSHIRFRRAYLLQGYRLEDLPYRSPFFPAARSSLFVMCLVVMAGQNYEAVLHGQVWEVASSYIGLPLFGVVWWGYHVARKDRVVPLAEMDVAPRRDRTRHALTSTRPGRSGAGTPGCAACHPWVSPGVAVRERRGTS